MGDTAVMEPPTWIMEFAANHAVAGGALLIGWVLMQKWLIPITLGYLKNEREKKREAIEAEKQERKALESEKMKIWTDILDSIKASLNRTAEAQTEMQALVFAFRNHEAKVESMVQSLVMEDSHFVDERRALKSFASTMDKQLNKMLVEFMVRREHNHILSQSQVVSGRYMREGEKLAGKTRDLLGEEYLNGQYKLSDYWGASGCESFFKHLAHDFYCAHYMLAEAEANRRRNPDLFVSDEDVANLEAMTIEDYKNALDRLLSVLMGSFKAWLEDSEKTYGAQKLTDMASFKIMFAPAHGKVELL